MLSGEEVDVVDTAASSTLRGQASPPPGVDEAAFSALLSEFAGTLATEFPIQSILDHLVERIVDLLPIDAAGVTVIAPDLEPRFVASSDARALRYMGLQTDLGQGPCVTAYLTGQPVSVPNLIHERRFPQFASAAVQAGLKAVFSFPLRHPGGRLGALDLYRTAPDPLGSRALEVAQTLADVTSAYLLNAQAREEALIASERHRLRSLHDPLTGLPNRLLLQDRLRHAAQRAERSPTGAAVIFVDIDGFKKINDALGHQRGDQVLIAIAERLSHQVRPSDTLSRFAGDEFVLLCEDVERRVDAAVIWQRVLDSFATPFPTSVDELRVAASVGMAYAGPGERICEALIAQADQSMYRMKGTRTRAGRRSALRALPSFGLPALRQFPWPPR
jgi:diguanylate cyclase (GGDEF)-like protein